MKYINYIVLISIFILLVSNIYVYNNYQKTVDNIDLLNKKIEELENKIVLEEKKNKNWELFENKKYKYIISYPEIAEIKNINIEQCGNECLDIKGFYYLTTYRIIVYNKPTSNNLADYVNNIFKNSVATLDSAEWIDIAEQKGYQINASVDYSVIYTYTINGNYLYEINVINPNEESLIIYDKILESFKFTN